MLPPFLRTIFWDIDADAFVPGDWPDYSIFRVLEYGDEEAVAWMRQTFSESEIRRVIRAEHRLTPKSANFWALIYDINHDDVAALRGAHTAAEMSDGAVEEFRPPRGAAESG